MLNVSRALRAIQSRLGATFLLPIGFLLAVGFIAAPAAAQVIERIEINQVGNEVEIQVRFITRIQYLRQALLKNGDIRIYLNLLEVDPLDARLIPETKNSPPSTIAPRFKITYPELDSSLTVSFSKAVSYYVAPGKDGRSISIFTPAIKPKGEPAAAAVPVIPPVVPRVPDVGKVAPDRIVTPSEAAVALPSTPLRTVEEVELEAKRLIGGAQDALKRGQPDVAVEVLNRLLNLPPNQQSQAAQALVGEAREKNGEFAKARSEYELYLKLYPKADDARKIENRLAKLPAEPKEKIVPQVVVKQSVDEKMASYGSLTQNYYKGISRSEVSGSGTTPTVLDATDQSQLISSLDVTGRKRTETTDTRIVMRDDYRANFLSGTKNENRLNSLYVEQSARDQSYLYRLGRQNAVGGGVPGRFDGGLLSYNLNPTWRVNGVAGTPVEFTGGGVERKTFAGISADLTRLPEQWSGSIYYIQQRVGGITDSRSVGGEAHYFDAKQNYTGQFDYDTLFKAVNIAMFQANWINDAGDNYLILADHRKSPPLQISNALPGQTTPSVKTLIESGVSRDALLAAAQPLSANSNLFMVGMTHPFSPRFRLGGDFRLTNISGTGASGTLPAVPGTGNTYIFSVQAMGNNLLFENDLGVASASYINARTYSARSLSFTQVETFFERWRVDVALQMNQQNDNFGVSTTRVIPSFKLGYQMNESVSLESEGGIEFTNNTSAIQQEKTRRRYFYVGYRWDFGR